MKGDLDSKCIDYLEKAANIIEKLSNEDAKKSFEWKALKISTYRNLSEYHKLTGNAAEALDTLKLILPLQKELEEANVILPGAEFLYINSADLAFKLKTYEESTRFARMGTELLEKQLNIENDDISGIKSLSMTRSKNSKEDANIQIVRCRKYIGLGYSFYLLGKSLLKSKDLNSLQQAVTYLEKSFTISNHFMGSQDRITLSYKKKYEAALELLNALTAKNESRREKKEPQRETKELKHSQSEAERRVNPKASAIFMTLNFNGVTMHDDQNLPQQRSKTPQGNNTLQTERQPTSKKSDNLSFQEPKHEPRKGNFFAEPVPSTQSRKAGRKLQKSDFFNPPKINEHILQKDDLMIFEVDSQTPPADDQRLKANILGKIFPVKKPQPQAGLRLPSPHNNKKQLPNVSDKISKLVSTNAPTPKDSLTASTSLQTFSMQHRFAAGNFISPAVTGARNRQQSARQPVVGLDFASLQTTPKVTTNRDNLTPSNMNFAALLDPKELEKSKFAFLSKRPQTAQSKGKKRSFSGTIVSIQKSERGSSAIGRTEEKNKPVDVEFSDFSNNLPASATASRRNSGMAFYNVKEKKIIRVNYSPINKKKPPSLNVSSSNQTDEIDPVLDDLLKEGAQGRPNKPPAHRESVPLSFNPDSSSVHGPNPRLSTNLIEYLRWSVRNDPDFVLDGSNHKRSNTPGPKDMPESPKLTGSDHETGKFMGNIGTLHTQPEEKKEIFNAEVISRRPKFTAGKDINDFRKIEIEAAKVIQKHFRQVLRKRNFYQDAEDAAEEQLAQTPGGGLMNVVKGVIAETAKQKGTEPQNTVVPTRISAGHLIQEEVVVPVNQNERVQTIPHQEDAAIYYNYSKSFDIQIDEDFFDLDESELSFNSSKVTKLGAAKPRINPDSSEKLLIKVESMKESILNLKRNVLKFYKKIQGFKTYWALGFKEMQEADGYLHFKLLVENEKITHELNCSIDITRAEKIMFQYSIWPIVASSAEFQADYLENDDTLQSIDEKNHRELFENPIFVVGLNSKKALIKLGAKEETSIQKLLARVTSHIKSKTTRYRKKNGFILKNAKADREAELVRRNREVIQKYKAKYAQTIKKLSTHHNYYCFSHDYQSFYEREVPKLSEVFRSERRRKEGTHHRTLIQKHSIEDLDSESNSSIRITQTYQPSKDSLPTLEDELEKRNEAPLSHKETHTSAKTFQAKAKPREPKRMNTVTSLVFANKPVKLRSNLSFKRQTNNLQVERVGTDHRPRERVSRETISSKSSVRGDVESYKNPFLKK